MKKGSRKSARIVRTLQLFMWTVLVVIQMSVVGEMEVRAEEEVERRVEQELWYGNVEGAVKIPEQVQVQVWEGGQEAVAVCRLDEAVCENEEWQDGFELPVTFHIYDADSYLLGSSLVPRNDAVPQLQGYEEELLAAAGLSSEEYRILEARWDGGSYTDEDGELCRDAIAAGQKLVRSYRARYTGTAVFPVQEVLRTTPVPAQAARPGTMQETEAGTTESGSETAGAGGLPVSPEEDAAGRKAHRAAEGLLERITKILLVVVAIGALLFFLGLFLLAVLHMAKMIRMWYNKKKR